MRLATANNKLILLFAAQHQIYDTRYWEVEGENFYALHSDADNIYISSATFPNEKPLSLYINKEPILKTITSKRRRLASKQYLMCAITETNQNLVDFYNTYPVSTINNDFGTRWALYANTPLSETARQSLYPSLNRAIKHYNQIIAVKKLLNWVQTAFVYKLDDEVWGHDRAFFAEESLYYPYCDCEDRSILFSRIVRDLVGLDVVLIYYPGHLATAVRFTEAVQGDYVTIGNQRYTICDPTYIGAPIGRTMPGMDNSQAKVIILN